MSTPCSWESNTSTSRLLVSLSAVQSLFSLINQVLELQRLSPRTPSNRHSDSIPLSWSKLHFLHSFTHSLNTFHQSQSTPSHELCVMISQQSHHHSCSAPSNELCDDLHGNFPTISIEELVIVILGQRSLPLNDHQFITTFTNTDIQTRTSSVARVGYMVKTVSANTENTKKHWELVRTRTPFLARYGHPWTQKRSENDHFRDALSFYNVFPTFCRRFPTWCLIPNAQKGTFSPNVQFQRS